MFRVVRKESPNIHSRLVNALNCVKTQELFRPRDKKYGSIDFTLTYTKCGKGKKLADEQINYSKP